jgi:hypothetical protein
MDGGLPETQEQFSGAPAMNGGHAGSAGAVVGGQQHNPLM